MFFADETGVDQLRITLNRIAQQATADRTELSQVVSAMDQNALSDRTNINALSIRLVSDIQATVQHWARWALEETSN